MSKYFHEICSMVMESNKDIYNGPSQMLKQIEDLKQDIRKLQLKIDQIHHNLVQITKNR